MKQKTENVKDLISEAPTVIKEFTDAYSILVEACIYQEKTKGYMKLYKHTSFESKPPTNLNYLNFKAGLDNHLSKLTCKIYKVLNLH